MNALSYVRVENKKGETVYFEKYARWKSIELFLEAFLKGGLKKSPFKDCSNKTKAEEDDKVWYSTVDQFPNHFYYILLDGEWVSHVKHSISVGKKNDMEIFKKINKVIWTKEELERNRTLAKNS